MHAFAHLGYQPVDSMHIEQRAYQAAAWPWRERHAGLLERRWRAGPSKITKLIIRLTALPSCRHHKYGNQSAAARDRWQRVRTSPQSTYTVALEPTFLTGRSEVMSRGCCSLSWPTSDAHVSPQQLAK